MEPWDRARRLGPRWRLCQATALPLFSLGPSCLPAIAISHLLLSVLTPLTSQLCKGRGEYSGLQDLRPVACQETCCRGRTQTLGCCSTSEARPVGPHFGTGVRSGRALGCAAPAESAGSEQLYKVIRYLSGYVGGGRRGGGGLRPLVSWHASDCVIGTQLTGLIKYTMFVPLYRCLRYFPPHFPRTPCSAYPWQAVHPNATSGVSQGAFKCPFQKLRSLPLLHRGGGLWFFLPLLSF